MEICKKYVIEFSVENTTEIVAICDSISSVKNYLFEKFKFNEDTDVYNNNDYIIVINLEYGKIKVRCIDFVGD